LSFAKQNDNRMTFQGHFNMGTLGIKFWISCLFYYLYF